MCNKKAQHRTAQIHISKLTHCDQQALGSEIKIDMEPTVQANPRPLSKTLEGQHDQERYSDRESEQTMESGAEKEMQI